MSGAAIPWRISSSTAAPTSSASARSPPASSSRTAPLGSSRVGRRLEQRALEVVERWARAGGVVLGALGQVDDLGRERAQLLDGGRAPGERHAAGLVRQRDADVGLGVAAERLDRVALGRRQVVEAVEEDRAPAPGLPGRRAARRAPPRRSPRDPAGRAAPAAAGRRSRARRARPRTPARPPPAAHARSADVNRAGVTSERWSSANSAPAASAKPGVARRAGERAQRHVGDRRADDALARDAARAAAPRSPVRRRDLAHEPREREHLGAEHDPRAGQLALVVLDVSRRRHDEQRVARQRGAQALEHGACLGGVRGAGDRA